MAQATYQAGLATQTSPGLQLSSMSLKVSCGQAWQALDMV